MHIMIKSDDELLSVLAFFVGAAVGVAATFAIRHFTNRAKTAKQPVRYRPPTRGYGS